MRKVISYQFYMTVGIGPVKRDLIVVMMKTNVVIILCAIAVTRGNLPSSKGIKMLRRVQLKRHAEYAVTI